MWTNLNGWRWSLWWCSVRTWAFEFLLLSLTNRFIFLLFLRNSELAVFVIFFLAHLMILRNLICRLDLIFTFTFTRKFNNNIFFNLFSNLLLLVFFYFPWKFSLCTALTLFTAIPGTVFDWISHFSLVQVDDYITIFKTAIFFIIALLRLFCYLLNLLNLFWLFHFLVKVRWS